MLMLILLLLFILLAAFTAYRQYQQIQGLTREKQAALAKALELQAEMTSLAVKIQDLEAERAGLRDNLANAQAESQVMIDQYTKSMQALQALQTEFDGLTARYQDLEITYANLGIDYQNLTARTNTLQGQYDSLESAYFTLDEQKRNLESSYNQLQEQYTALMQNAVQPPYIAVSDRTARLAFYRSNRAIDYWDFSFYSLEQSFEVGFVKRGLMNLPLVELILTTPDGITYHAPDFRSFVDPQPFTEMVSELYEDAPNDRAFLHEVWYIVAQLTTYSLEMGEVPRMPLETLLAGGGDCEDTSILYASMVKAAPVDWEVSIVYMNGKTPTDRRNPNHVAVRVDTGSERFIIETTDDVTMTPYEGMQVDAWFYEIQ
jgi:predicted nuclease with TOPRIM domain